MRRLILALLPTLVGCAEFSEVHETQLPAEGVWNVFADSERGSFVYAGTAEDETFDVAIRSWATGSTRKRAEARASNNVFGAQVVGDLLDLWGRSPVEKAGVDLAVVGPSVINVESVLLEGRAELFEVDGYHTLTANQIYGSGIHGDVDFYASSDGIDVEVFPYADSVLRLEAFGDVVLGLPYGLEYELEVFSDPSWGVTITDLGFDSLFIAPDYVSASTGSGSIKVEVYLVGGSFVLWEAVE